MSIKRALIRPQGFMGDYLFATSVARRFHTDQMFDEVHFVNGIPQLNTLLNLNPYIDAVYTTLQPTSTTASWTTPSHEIYDAIFDIPLTTKLETPPAQFQRACGIQLPDTQFFVNTDCTVDAHVYEQLSDDYIAVMHPSTWREKAFRFTVDEYRRGHNVPYLGYGGRLRDIDTICTEISKHFPIVYVGLPADQPTLTINNNIGLQDNLTLHASIIKNAKCFVGTEGGLANLACAVGTPTILTGDFVHQLYGWNGVINKIHDPQLGPRFYFPNENHIDLNPYYDDDNVMHDIIDNIQLLINAGKFYEKNYDWVHPEYE